MIKTNEEILERVERQKEAIGQLLLKHTSLAKEQLEEALTLQRESGMLLGQILIKKGHVHPHDLIKMLCLQIGIPYMDTIDIESINPELTADISINYAKSNEVIPLFATDYSITVAMCDPFRANVLNDMQGLFGKEIKLVITSPLKIQDAINRVYEKVNRHLVDSIEDEFEENLDLEGPIDILEAGPDEAPVIRFVNSIIFRAVKDNASDIHIEPYEKETVYRFRINGVMSEILRQPIKTHSAVASRIKVMGKLDIAEKRMPQDGRIKIKIAGKDIDIRLSTVPVSSGERIVMRILEKSVMVFDLEALGFQGKVLAGLNDLLRRKHGVVYVTGPTGHGKTTTLFALLAKINNPDRMIITVEDPVEYEIPGISQIQVNPKINLTFAMALRNILRQNPDIIMVGETRDQETAEMVVHSSLTGHFVLSTLHTNDAYSAPTRLIDMGVQPFLISSSLVAVLAQRLVRTLCEECKITATPSPFELNLLGVRSLPEGTKICRANGCPACNNTGYGGRTCVSELLVLNDEMRALILEKKDAATLKKVAMKTGMSTLRQDAMEKVLTGITSIEEMVRAINEEDDALPPE
jgi:general secretion pathway protein E